jgi:hypothetical protein
MTLEELQKVIEEELKKINNAPNDYESFRECLINHTEVKYSKKIQQILNGDINLIASAFKNLLTTFWMDTKGTGLCYTAIPDQSLTKMFCAIAYYLSNDEKPPIFFLMPTINHNNYINIFNFVDIRIIPLEQLLRTHILSDDCNYLIPINLVLYLNIETDIKEVMKNPYCIYPLHFKMRTQANAKFESCL